MQRRRPAGDSADILSKSLSLFWVEAHQCVHHHKWQRFKTAFLVTFSTVGNSKIVV